MDSGIIIITLILLIICVVPFLIMSNNARKRKKKFFDQLESMAKKHHGHISAYDLWHHASIGTDEKGEMIFYVKKMDSVVTPLQIKLEDIQRVRIIKTSRTVGTKEGATTIMDKIELALTPVNKTGSDILLEFYNVNAGSAGFANELQLAEKWEKLINQYLAVTV